MAMIKCGECGRDISDKAAVCLGCGAPVTADSSTPKAPARVRFDGTCFAATKAQLVDLAREAIGGLGHRVDTVDLAAGTITFTSGMTMGSWSGVSGSLQLVEVEPFRFTVTGQAKQNVKGGQLIALDLFGEAGRKITAVIERMKAMAEGPLEPTVAMVAPTQEDVDPGFVFMVVIGVVLLIFLAAFLAGV